MRIGGFNQITQIYNNSTVRPAANAKRPGFSDALEISGAGKDYQLAKQAVSAVPDVREDVVADIKARIAEGSYQIPSSVIADKLLADYEG